MAADSRDTSIPAPASSTPPPVAASPVPENEETPAPVTVAEGGRGSSEAYVVEAASPPPEIQAAFYAHIRRGLSVERLEAYGDASVAPSVV